MTTATGALLLAPTTSAWAQQTPSTAPAAADEQVTGLLDVGARITSTEGDAARYERYRDLRSGVSSNIFLGKVTDQYMWNVSAENIGYHDQRYIGSYTSGKAKVTGLFDAIPL